MGRLERGDPVIYVQKFEPKATRGSNRGGHIRTNKFFGCFSGELRHSGFHMVEWRSNWLLQLQGGLAGRMLPQCEEMLIPMKTLF